MEKESYSDEFERSLREQEASRALNFPSDPVWEASRRFEQTYEPQLIEAAKSILQSDSVSPIVEIMETAGTKMAKQGGFEILKDRGDSKFGNCDRFDHHWFRDGGTDSFQRVLVFDVKHLKKYGDKCYITYQDEGKFVQAIENGEQIAQQINGFRIEYRYMDYLLAVNVFRDHKGVFSIIKWEAGGSKGTIQIQDSNFTPLIELFTSKIAEGRRGYEIFLGGAPSWADPGYGGGLS